MVVFCITLLSIAFVIISQKRGRRRYQKKLYETRIKKLEERFNVTSGDCKYACENQLRFWKRSYKEYLSQKSSFF